MTTAKSKGQRPRIASVADYLANQPTRSRVVFRRIRALVKRLFPDAVETISYQLPAFKRGRVFIYFAAFTSHVGIYPPVRGNPSLSAGCAIALWNDRAGDQGIGEAVLNRNATSKRVICGG